MMADPCVMRGQGRDGEIVSSSVSCPGGGVGGGTVRFASAGLCARDSSQVLDVALVF